MENKNRVNIKLNGKKLHVTDDLTIWDVAKEQGVEIPTFCHNKRLAPFASCFICVVEVEGMSKLLPSCSTKVTNNMAIQTDSQKVKDARKMALDLMLSDHVGDCIGPCEEHCPAHTDVQGYVAHIAAGDFEAATRLIKSKLALPIVCGTICPNPCEHQCRRNLVGDDAIAIRDLKRFAAEYEIENGPFLPPVASSTGKKIDIVGGGPAGLAGAYYLRQMGHEVHIHESLPLLGGMVRYGIPKFRMPWDRLDAEIKAITDLGVHVHHNRTLGKDFTIADLKNRGADAVMLAVGAQSSKPMGVENENAEGIIGGVHFLRDVVLGKISELPKEVAVIGGGDVAMDCARVAKRFNSNVTILYRRTQKEMPALHHEQVEAEEEGVIFQYLTAPIAVNSEDGKMTSLRITKMELGEPDDSGRRRPVPISGSEKNLEFGLVISSIGQDPDVTCIDNEKTKPATTRWKTFEYDQQKMTTSIKGVFTAGDCAYGPDTVVRSLAEGRQAALSIDMYLRGAEMEFKSEYAISKGRIEELNSEDFAPRFKHSQRANGSVHPPQKRLQDGGYAPIYIGMDKAQAMAEASRCIECGCNAKLDCSLRKYATDYNATETRFVGKKRIYSEDRRHPLVKFEQEKCINCASCVRLCNEVRDISALTFVDRGFVSHIAPQFEEALQNTNCDACGMCIDVCPTGTISSYDESNKSGPWPHVDHTTTCTSCTLGCALSVSIAEGKIRKVKSIEGDPVNNGVICKEGRFSWRLEDNLVSYNSLEEGLTVVRSSKKMAVLLSARTSIEDIFTISKFCEEKDAKLFYMTTNDDGGKVDGKKPFPFSKQASTANVSILKQLNAKAWDQDNYPSTASDIDCLIMIDSHLKNPLSGSVKIIALSNFPVGIKSDINLRVNDPIKSNGMFLNNDGDLGLMSSPLCNEEYSISNIFSTLGELDGDFSIGTVREKMSSILPKLIVPPQTKANQPRQLINSQIAPVIANIAPTAREVAFKGFLEKMNLV